MSKSTPPPPASQQKKPVDADKKMAMQIAKDNKVDTVYKNSAGEFFTRIEHALLSDKQENITTYNMAEKSIEVDKETD
ncbi:MAG: hypothetical protein EAZ35_02220 [Sphingobacteriia bacterium]|nr:MAG: hypothetical protein EAZ35_02220 [Sphingobacteriia bacterium]